MPASRRSPRLFASIVACSSLLSWAVAAAPPRVHPDETMTQTLAGEFALQAGDIDKAANLYLQAARSADKDAGLDAVGRLVNDGVAVAIKYAVVLDDPLSDAYLEGLLRRVDRQRVVSGMGERPAIVHMRDFGLPGFTTGSGCIASRACSMMFEACVQKDWSRAAGLRADFMPLEDLRDAWGPARVLHHATELAGIATTGPIPPYVSLLSDTKVQELAPVARALRERDALVTTAPSH